MFRSQSGPGALSINTTSANSLPALSSLAPPSSGPSKPPFGASVAPSQPQASSSPFENSAAPTQPQTSSLFGNAQTQAGNTQPSQQQGGSLFGNQNSSTQSTAGGLFGSKQPQQQSSNTFGSNNAQQTQPQLGGGLFGSTLGQTQSQQPNNNLFGGANNQNRPSLFGNPAPAQNQQSTMQPPPPPSMFSATIGQHTQQQQTIPGVRISVNELRPTTRFNDLHEELQKTIEYVDSFILNKMQWKDECQQGGDKVSDMCLQLPPDVEYCSKQLDTMQQALENDAESIAFAKGLVKVDAADAKLSFKVIQNLRLPQQFHQTSLWSTAMAPQTDRSGAGEEDVDDGASRNIVEYFSKQTEIMSRTLENYKHNIAQVENYLKGVESNTMQQMHQLVFSRGQDGNGKSAEDQVRELAAVLRAFENGILGVATKVGSARENVQDVMLGTASASGSNARGSRFGAMDQ